MLPRDGLSGALVWLSLADNSSRGDEPAVPGLPTPEPLHSRIDRLISAQPGFDDLASEAASDAEFVRRVHLDLAGVIPTSTETRGFLDDPSDDKRVRLVDRLLESPR